MKQLCYCRLFRIFAMSDAHSTRYAETMNNAEDKFSTDNGNKHATQWPAY